MKTLGIFFLGVFYTFHTYSQTTVQVIEPISFSNVKITDNFWKPKLEKVAKATIQACILNTEQKTGRIRNFEKAARKQNEKHEGIYYDDSDVYKALEAMAYSLKNHPDPILEAKADEWIDKIAAAQESDGYLNTFYSLTGLEKRWKDMEKHEDYCAGHLFEAAVAYFNTTGKRKLLDVSIKFANHIDQTFRLANRPWVSGHQEIELALVKLYKCTQNQNYLKLADWYLDQRGKGHGKGLIWDQWKDPNYCQDAVPVKEQKEITGHAVRAMYLYTGAADVAAHTDNKAYMKAMTDVWEDVVHRNMYVTGGIGSSGSNEGFSNDFDLPNENAYCETCASVGMVFWNQRMNSLTGQSKYIDILERSLYNAALDGLSLSGDRFFYGNPLASTGSHVRKEWFGTACCPSNIARLVSSVGDYIYGKSSRGLFVNLFIGSQATMKINEETVEVEMKTNYPFEGKMVLGIQVQKPSNFEIHVRIPSWLGNRPVDGNLYMSENVPQEKMLIKVNGKNMPFKIENGYAVLESTWKSSDQVEISFQLSVKKVSSKQEVKQNLDRVALQRGPLVYCVEGADNEGKALDFILSPKASFKLKETQIGSESVLAIETQGIILSPDPSGLSVIKANKKVTAIPYYIWCNRGQNQMQVWMPTKFKEFRVN
jgi:uncharacterized protein